MKRLAAYYVRGLGQLYLFKSSRGTYFVGKT